MKRALSAGFLFSALSIVSFIGHVEAAEFFSGVEVIVGPDEVINDDVYAFAGRLVIDGTINGDLLAASESIEINGQVNGDLIIAARAVDVSGTVEDDIRAAAANLRFNSSVGGDLITAGDEVSIEAEATIGEDLVASANSLRAEGDVAGNLDLNAVEASIGGSVQGNVTAIVEEQLILLPDAEIAGALNYTSRSEVAMQPGAEIFGEVNYQIPAIEIFGNEFQVTAIIELFRLIIDQVKWFFGTVLVGLVLIWLFPGTMQGLNAILSESPFKSLFSGVLVLLIVPVVLLLTMIIVLSIIGSSAFSLIAIPGILYLSLLLVAKPVIAIPIGGYVARYFTKRDCTLKSALVIGAALLAVLGCIPFIDTVTGWLTLILGFGMCLLYFYRGYRGASQAT